MKSFLILLGITALMMVPIVSFADSEQKSGTNPPISQPLVREGTLAVKLVDALQIGTTTSEVEAESLLVSAGVAPRNGWIADYPVTPDIASELRDAVSDAADSGSIAMDKEAALGAYDGVLDEYGLAVKSDTSGGAYEESAGSPDETVVNNYYYSEGPPVVTYYAPPPAYAYLYTWVPYPFWWWDFWFPGFYVLADFNRVIVVGRHAHVVSNHFFDHKSHSFHRISPAQRFRERDTAIGRGGRVIGPAGMRPGADTALSTHRYRPLMRGDREAGRTYRGRATISAPQRSMGSAERSRSFYKAVRATGSDNRLTTSNAPYGGERTITAPRVHSGRSVSRVSGGRALRIPSDGRVFSAPERSGRGFSQPASRGLFHESFAPSGGGGRSGFGGRRWR